MFHVLVKTVDGRIVILDFAYRTTAEDVIRAARNDGAVACFVAARSF